MNKRQYIPYKAIGGWMISIKYTSTTPKMIGYGVVLKEYPTDTYDWMIFPTKKAAKVHAEQLRLKDVLTGTVDEALSNDS